MAKKHPWLASYPSDIDWDEPIPQKPVYRLLDDTAKNYPKRTAIDFLGAQLSYEELADAVARAAAGFKKLGVKKGVHVGLFLPNCPQHIIAYYAILKAGGTVVNFSPLYSQSELEYQINDSNVQIMVTLNLEVLYPKIAPLLGFGKFRHIVVSTLTEVLPWPKNILFALFKRKELAQVEGGEGFSSFVTLLEQEPVKRGANVTAADDLAVLQYTGGTTGVPKGAMLSHHNVYANAIQCARWCPPEAADGKQLVVLPMFHAFAMTACLNMGIALGMTLVLQPRFEVDKALKAIARHKPTMLHGVPAMYNAIATNPATRKYDLTSLVACISGGAPLPLEVKKNFEAVSGCDLVEGYGLTETAPVASCNPVSEACQTGTIGLPLPGTRLEIVSKEGDPVEPGKRGELVICGPQVMLGYYNKPEATAECLEVCKDGSRRLQTGDIAIQHEDGFTQIVDRIKDMIIMNGFNVYPRNVEEAIYRHPSVLECAVIGVPDDARGEAIKAFIALKPGKKLLKDELTHFLRDHLGKHELPTEVEFRDELPRTMIGKVDKKVLKAQAAPASD